MHCSGSVYPLASAHLDVLALERLLELGSLKFVGIVRLVAGRVPDIRGDEDEEDEGPESHSRAATGSLTSTAINCSV